MSMFTRMFGSRRRVGQKLGFVEAQRRVLDYARYLEHSAPMPGRIVDASLLPHSKAELKAALLLCLANTEDRRLDEHLRAGFMMLSAFQPGVGEKPLGTDFASMDLEADPEQIAQQIELEFAATSQWRAQVEAELESLQLELYKLELELAQPTQLSA